MSLDDEMAKLSIEYQAKRIELVKKYNLSSYIYGSILLTIGGVSGGVQLLSNKEDYLSIPRGSKLGQELINMALSQFNEETQKILKLKFDY